MKICYKPRKSGPRSLHLCAGVNEVLSDLAARGYYPTLRQLFYQLVARNIIENSKKGSGVGIAAHQTAQPPSSNIALGRFMV